MIRRFVNDESGMETIEFVVVLAVVAGLIAVVMNVGQKITNVGGGAQKKVNDNLTDEKLKEIGITPQAPSDKP